MDLRKHKANLAEAANYRKLKNNKHKITALNHPTAENPRLKNNKCEKSALKYPTAGSTGESSIF